MVIPEVRKQLKLGPEVKFSWSQRAGCTCGCSPGFIITGALRVVAHEWSHGVGSGDGEKAFADKAETLLAEVAVANAC